MQSAKHDGEPIRARTASTGADNIRDRAAARMSPLACLLLGVLSLLIMAVIFGGRVTSTHYVDDFTGFLVGSKLLGSGQLYDPSTNLTLQRQMLGATDPRIIFVRPPFWALALKPLLNLRYRSALLIWRWLMAAALVAFIAMSRDPRVMLAVCCSVPAAGAIAMGSDSPLILVLIGISLVCHRKRWLFASGSALGLCLAKFHFLAFLPLLFLRRKYRSELKGFATAVAVLITVNFAVQPDWIPLYWQGLNMPRANMNALASKMPNVFSLFSWTAHPGYAVVAGGIAIGACLWRVCANSPFGVAMPLCVFGATLAAPHTNYLDGVLAIPAIFAAAPYLGRYRWIGWLLLSPLAGFSLLFGPPYLGPALVVPASLWLLWRVSGSVASLGGPAEPIQPEPGLERNPDSMGLFDSGSGVRQG